MPWRERSKGMAGEEGFDVAREFYALPQPYFCTALTLQHQSMLTTGVEKEFSELKEGQGDGALEK